MRLNWHEPKFYLGLTVFIILIISIFIGQIISGFSYKFALALILGSTVFIVTLINTDAGLAILIFSMLLSPEIILGQVPGRDIVVRFDDLLLVVITFTWLAKTAINKGLALFIKTPVNKAMSLYLLVCLLATLRGIIFGYVVPAKGLFYILRYAEYFLLFILVANQIHGKKQIKFFLSAFFIVCAIVSIYGIIQIPGGVRVSAPFEGEVGEPNTFGGYLLFILCLATGISLQNVPQKLKMTLFGLGILIIIPFFYTLSRASYLAIIFSFLTFIVLSKKRVILVTLVATLIVCGVVFKPESVFSRVEYTFQERQLGLARIGNIYLDSSSSARIFSWKEGIKAWTKNPIFGRGVTGFAFIDSQYVLTLPELGIIGFLALIWLLWSIFKHSFNVLRKMEDELDKGLTLGFVAGFIGLCTHALTANTFIILRIMEPFCFILGIIMVLPKLKEESLERAEVS